MYIIWFPLHIFSMICGMCYIFYTNKRNVEEKQSQKTIVILTYLRNKGQYLGVSNITS